MGIAFNIFMLVAGMALVALTVIHGRKWLKSLRAANETVEKEITEIEKSINEAKE